MKAIRVKWNRLTALFLAASMLLSLCGCGLNMGAVKDKANEIGGKAGEAAKAALSKTGKLLSDAQETLAEAYGSAKDGVIYVYDEAAEMTSVGYEKASEKATEIIGDTGEYISTLLHGETAAADVYAEGDPARPVKDLSKGELFNDADALTIDKSFSTEQFVTYYISSVLDARGYEIHNGAVYYKGEIYGGLIFTKGEAFIEEDGQTIQSCGFVQLVGDDYDGVLITDSMVQTGLVAVSSGSNGTESEPFIVDEYAVFDDFSGIFNDLYFCIRQTDHYVLSVSIKENSKSNYISGIELYDFDNEEYIHKPDKQEEIEQLYVEDNQTFKEAAATVNAIVDVGNNSPDEVATVLILDGSVLDTLMDKAASGADAVTDFIRKAAKGISLENNQYLSIDKKGKAHVLGSEKEIDEARLTNGVITTISSGLAATGAVVSIVFTAPAGTAVVTAIVITTGACTIVYSLSEMFSGVQDIYYGTKGSANESRNPVLELFRKAISDDQTATLLYHIWGVGNTLASNLMMPVAKALRIAKVKGLNSFQTAAGVIRASLITLAKAAAAGVGAGIVSRYVSKIATKVSGSENIGKLAGFGICLITGFLVYKGLDAIDQNLDVSGLYPKTTVKQFYFEARDEQAEQLLAENLAAQQRGETERVVNDVADLAKEWYGLETDPTIKIVYDPHNPSGGTYDFLTDTVTINMRSAENKDIRGLADTIAHEMRHAWQWQEAINNPESPIADSLLNYIEPKPDNSNYWEYILQPCEDDAFKAAAQFTEVFEDYITALLP